MNPAVAVPLLLITLCVLMAAAGPRLIYRQRRKKSKAVAKRTAKFRPWIHAINHDRCTGCEACVDVCPTNTLALIDHKSNVVFSDRCIECRQCAQACPTSALVMFRDNEQPPTLKLPELDPHLQTVVPGQYLIGEVAGKPLVKNAANMGRLVVEDMLTKGLTASPGTGASPSDPVDVGIIGSGPGGLSAALSCVYHGLSHLVLEKDTLIASTVSRYPKGKRFLAEPYDCANLSFLPVFDAQKEDLVATWQRVVDETGVAIRKNTAVDTVNRLDDGTFEIKLAEGAVYARRVVMGIGTRGKARTLGVPGESLIKVATMLDDPGIHRDQDVLVVGGGDTALEAAMAMSDCGAAKVTLSYRGKAFSRAKKKNRDALEQRIARGKMEVLFGSHVKEIRDNDVIIELADGRRIHNDAVYVLIGADAPIKWLEKTGVSYVDRQHDHKFGATDEIVRGLTDAQECPTDAAKAIARILHKSEAAAAAPRNRLPRRTNGNIVRRGERSRQAAGSHPPGVPQLTRSHRMPPPPPPPASSGQHRVLQSLVSPGAEDDYDEGPTTLFDSPNSQTLVTRIGRRLRAITGGTC